MLLYVILCDSIYPYHHQLSFYFTPILQDALKAHKIEPKENISKLVKWAREIQKVAADMNMLRTFMQDGLALKCDKSEHQVLCFGMFLIQICLCSTKD